jgi:hypothetical protein
MNRDWRITFAERVAPRLAGRGLSGAIKVVIEGEDAPQYVSLDGDPSVTAAARGAVVAILRASGQDLEALLAGRMSLADGMLTERIGVSGAMPLVVGLGALLQDEVA